MTRFARIIEAVAVDVVTQDPTALFHPEIAAQFEPVPDNVERGWHRTGTVWAAPATAATPAAATIPRKTVVTPPEFLLLFTASERIAIRTARGSDPVVADWLAILEDPRLSEVDVSRPATLDGLAYLASKGLITQARAAEIALGAPL